MPCLRYFPYERSVWDTPANSYSYIPYSYASSYYDSSRVSADDHLEDKVRLRSRLDSGVLSNMPAGFPFRYVFNGQGSAYISYDSYEFKEDIRASTSRRSSAAASISYTSPGHKKSRNNVNYHTWKVYPPTSECFKYTRTCDRIAVAQVQVDEAVMRTPFGSRITDDPRVILQALAISLELGILITIEIGSLSSKTHQTLGRLKPHLSWSSGSILYIGRHHSGKKELLCVAPEHRKS
ncbi:hypothetical protein BDQ17DRAFT_1347849 [Cyathus striatus]|nr:hypothetical protein BDQ17DRAFT_1347849 [Cyathus striatus]